MFYGNAELADELGVEWEAFHTTMFYGNTPEEKQYLRRIKTPFHTTMFYGN